MRPHGPADWSLSIDEEGYRTYKIQWKVDSGDPSLGPRAVSLCPGLPMPYSLWIFNLPGMVDRDEAAFCYPSMDVKKMYSPEEPGQWWFVTQTFSTKPLKNCEDAQNDNPLLQPPKISGSFVKYTKEAVTDRNGKLLKNSSHELFRGSLVERDANRQQLNVEMNVATYNAALYAGLMDYLNDTAMWGCDAECVKFSECSFDRASYVTQAGQCMFYYTMQMTFDIQPEGWTRKIPDRGLATLLPGGNPNNPKHFAIQKDDNGENQPILLNGHGRPLEDPNNPFIHEYDLYPLGNLFALGIPAVI